MDGRPVAETEVVEPPQHLHVDVAAKLAVAEVAVVAVEGVTAAQRARHGRREAADQQAGNQRPQFLLFQQGQRRLHLSLLRRQLGPMGQADRDQFVRPIFRDR